MRKKEDKWKDYRKEGDTLQEKQRKELKGRPYSIIQDPEDKTKRVVLTPWKQILKWPDSAAVDFWDRMQDILSCLSDESLAKYVKEKSLTEEQGLKLMDFCDWVKEHSESLRMKRFEAEEAEAQKELREALARTKKNATVSEEEED